MCSSKKNRRPLSYADRVAIETGLRRGDRISTIARTIGRTPSVVAKEIKRNWTDDPKGTLAVSTRNLCVHRAACEHVDLCGTGCLVRCCRCKKWICNDVCPDFEAEMCPRHQTAPYCCNGCPENIGMGCRYPYRFYEARFAEDLARFRRSDARRGIDCGQEEFEKAIDTIRAGLKKGQSPAHIIATSEEVPFSKSTFYRILADNKAGDLAKIDLPRAVRYKARKKKQEGSRDSTIPRELLAGRTYDDFRNLSEELKVQAVEMDTVIGRKGIDSQCVLTLYFRRFHFQLFVLLACRDSDEVVKALDMLDLISDGLFGKLFPVILADRGTEFSNVLRMENRANGTPRTRVFFCDPLQSQQKGGCEKNHVELRKILPKGKTNFDALTGRDMAACMSHVNSYCRDSLEWWCPIDMARIVLPLTFTEALGIEKIDPKEVNLTPYLVPHAILKDCKKRR